MLNATDARRPQAALDLSKFWAFRLINLISVVSIFAIVAVLLIPIPYLNKQRLPSIIDLNFNNNAYSHAIKINTTKLPGGVLSVSFTTYNTDHIIGATTFGDTAVQREGNYLARFVNAHYHDKRKGLPTKLLVLDAYHNRFVVRRFALRSHEDSSYVQTESWVYVIPNPLNSAQVVDYPLKALLHSKQSNVHRTSYEDAEGRVVTQYQSGSSHMIGTIDAGARKIVFNQNAVYRTVTTVLFKPLNVYKLIVTTFHIDSPEPHYDVFYFSDEFDGLFERPQDISMRLEDSIPDNAFEINRLEPPKTSTIDYSFHSNKHAGLVLFELNHEDFKYDIVLSDHADSVVRLDLETETQPVLTTNTLDRLLVLVYDPIEPKPPKFYLFSRMLHYNLVATSHFY